MARSLCVAGSISVYRVSFIIKYLSIWHVACVWQVQLVFIGSVSY